jgi:O-antigen/teichoic acid export membrane protein
MLALARKRLAGNGVLGPAAIIFISANIANVANLAFNMIFARVMSPEQFADLTLLLTLKLACLSFFSAIQYAVSELSARMDHKEGRNLACRLSRLSFAVSIPLCCILVFGAEAIGHVLNFSDVRALLVLALATPLFLPLVIYRGLAQGRMDLPKMVGSFQLEWIVRLAGCWLLWQAGFGLTGITVALVLSLVFGLIFTMDRDDVRGAFAGNEKTKNSSRLIVTTLPYAGIFLAQIFALDGDIILAKSVLGPEEASTAAGMLLFQRVFFFAFLSFAAILQPYAAKGTSGDAGTRQALTRLLMAMMLISAVALAVVSIRPSLFAVLFLGPQYAHLGPLLVVAGVVGVSFMAAHLTTVYLIAKGKVFAPLWLLGLVGLQYLAFFIWVKMGHELSYETFLMSKVIILTLGAVLFTTLTLKPKMS